MERRTRTVKLCCMIPSIMVNTNIIHCAKDYNIKVYLNVNYGLESIKWVNMVHQLCSKCTTLMEDTNTRGKLCRDKKGYIGTSCTFCSFFSVNLKLLLKNKIINF